MKIGIVGAGIVGRLIAWHLCQHHHEIHLFTKGSADSEDACSSLAAGMISPFAELSLFSLSCHQMGLTALKWWPKILASLPRVVDYRSKGTLVVCKPSQKNLLQHYIAQVNHKLPNFPIPVLSMQEIQALEPAISEMIGCHLPEAQISPAMLFVAMNEYFATQNVSWHDYHDVTSITATNIISDKQSYPFDITVDCRGMGAKQAVPGLRGVRGEIIICYAKDVDLEHAIRVLHPRYPCYIVPRENQHFAIGATEIESESIAPITICSALELMSQAVHVLPGFYEANIVQMNAGCRPTMPDHLPIVVRHEGVIVINGMSRHGFLLAPAITNHVTQQWINNHDKCENKFNKLFGAHRL